MLRTRHIYLIIGYVQSNQTIERLENFRIQELQLVILQVQFDQIVQTVERIPEINEVKFKLLLNNCKSMKN